MAVCREERLSSSLIIWRVQGKSYGIGLGRFYEKRSDEGKRDNDHIAVCRSHDIGKPAAAVL